MVGIADSLLEYLISMPLVDRGSRECRKDVNETLLLNMISIRVWTSVLKKVSGIRIDE